MGGFFAEGAFLGTFGDPEPLVAHMLLFYPRDSPSQLFEGKIIKFQFKNR